jgi:hypothetical protein
VSRSAIACGLNDTGQRTKKSQVLKKGNDAPVDLFATGEGVAGSGFARLSVDGEAGERKIPVRSVENSQRQDGAQ